MEPLISKLLFWLIPTLYLICFACLAYSVIQVIKAGTESYSNVYTDQTARQFADIFFFIPSRRLLVLSLTGSITCFIIFFFLTGNFNSTMGIARGIIIGSIAAAFALRLPHRVLAILKSKRLYRFNEQLVDALMTMSNAMRSGSSIMQAFEHIVKQNVNPISQEFGLFLQQTRVGVKFEEALSNLDKRVNSEDLTLMISAIEIARQTGGNLTEVFEQIASTIRERIRIQGRIRTLTAQGRMQGIVVGIMPILLAVAMLLIDSALMAAFFASPVGLLAVGIVVVLEITGVLLIRKIIAIDI